MGYSDYKHQKGEKVIAIIDNNCSVLAPLPVAPVHETDMILLPKGLKALKQIAKKVGLDLRGTSLNLDGGFDSAHNRKCIFHAGLIPISKSIPATARPRNADANASSTKPSMRCGCAWSAPLPGKISSSDCCSALNAFSSGTMG